MQVAENACVSRPDIFLLNYEHLMETGDVMVIWTWGNRYD